MNTGTIAVLAGVLVVGVGIGSAIKSTTQGGQGNIASQQQLDMAVPDPEFCRQWGASAFVIDIEMYTTLNPSTSFVTQPALQPGPKGPPFANKFCSVVLPTAAGADNAAALTAAAETAAAAAKAAVDAAAAAAAVEKRPAVAAGVTATKILSICA